MNKQNSCYVSAATVWEMSIKAGLGKLEIPNDYLDVVRSQGFFELPITWAHAEVARQLPIHHKDPFDRLLISQTISEEMILVTVDEDIKKYDISVA